jgi:DNA-binding beta-propeller fold protein YncE
MMNTRQHTDRSTSLSCLLAVTAFVLALAGCAPVEEKPQESQRKVFVFPEPPDDPRFFYERTLYSEADVVAQDESESLVRQLTGQARGGGRLNKPYAVAAGFGRIYVSDTAARVVHIFDAANRRYSQIGESETGSLAKPMGVELDAAGNVYVADISQKVINIYDRDGKFQRAIGKKGDFDRPTGIAVDPAGERLFVVDIGGIQSENHRVRVFDLLNGEHLFDIGTRGTAAGYFNLPRDVAIGKDRRIYVVDGGNFRIQVFDWEGKFLASWGKAGRQLGDFARPKEIATDREGNVYVIDTAFGNFQIFDPEGEILLFIGNRGSEDAPASYMLPSGIAVDEDGRVFVVDQWFRKVDVFRPASLPEGAGGFRFQAQTAESSSKK